MNATISGSNAAPAGGLAVSANDMARWLMIQLDGGRLPGGNGAAVQRRRRTTKCGQPVILQPIEPRPE